jgi:hypothetical protein
MRYLLLMAFAGALWAQGTEPKAKADDYEVHGGALGAEYMVHSFSGEGQMFLAADFLVVEVALFPPKGGTVTANAGEFQLRVDGKTLTPAAPQTVAASLQRQIWDRGSQYGGAQQRRPGPPPRVPAPDYGTGLPPKEPVKADEQAVKTALPEGTFHGAVSGYLYFRYPAKARVRTVDLLHGDTVLKLK